MSLIDRRELLRIGLIGGVAAAASACLPNCGPSTPEQQVPAPAPTEVATPRPRIRPEEPVLDPPGAIFMEVDRSKFWTPPLEELTWFPNWPELHRGRHAAMRPLFFEGSAREDDPRSWGPLQAIKEIYYRKEGKPLVPDPIEVALNDAKATRATATRKGESSGSHGKCVYTLQERTSFDEPVVLGGQTFYDVPVSWEVVMGMLVGVLFPFKSKFLVPPRPGLEKGGKGIDAWHKDYWITRNRLSRVPYILEMNKERDGSLWYHIGVGIARESEDRNRWPIMRTNDLIDPTKPIVEDSSDRVAGVFLRFDNTSDRWDPDQHHDLGLDRPEVRSLIMEIVYNRQRILHRYSKKAA